MLKTHSLFLLLSLVCLFSLGCGEEKPEIIAGPVMDNGGMSEEELDFSTPAEETSGAY
ncbi:hypothetical protein SAMN06265222_101592 [Neorhodopirellula lusitana]|uniref:Secreted protein n=1 Tax=Neorhodopirellula lusitana TaxID=445327 RepID=A0ABY1PS51_9BACT|nr:hypothetical protein [Neorhodopirellula lusitana]SMP41478.1 hypothetical protein SAMN06265222_101592 [Neorhodopirellula lusitana]